MSYSVDAAVEAVELPTLDAIPYRSRAQAGTFELPPRGYPVLPLRDSRYREVGGVDFLTHVGT